MVELRRTYYLAGPMTGIEGHNFDKFDYFAGELRNRGYNIVSPAEIARSLPGKPGDLPYYEYIRADLKKLLECTDLILMPGWRGSRGALKELDIAEFINMRVWTIDQYVRLIRADYGDTSV